MKAYGKKQPTEEEKKSLEDLRRVYDKVVQSFPQVKKDDMVLLFSQDIPHAGFTHWTGVGYNQLKFYPAILSGKNFAKLSEEMKEGCIAHELGHYCDAFKLINKLSGKDFYKDLNHPVIQRMIRQKRITKKAYLYAGYSPLISVLKVFSKKIRHTDKRLKQWYLVSEQYADNKAFEAGYGKQVIEVLKYFKPFASPSSKTYLTARIKNLEEKLRGVGNV